MDNLGFLWIALQFIQHVPRKNVINARTKFGKWKSVSTIHDYVQLAIISINHAVKTMVVNYLFNWCCVQSKQKLTQDKSLWYAMFNLRELRCTVFER